MAVDVAAPLARIVSVLQAVSGIGQVVSGVPESLPQRLTVYVTLDRWQIEDKAAGGLLRHRVDYGITFARRVGGDESGAETGLATVLPAAVAALMAERATKLNGTVVSMGLPDFSRAADPQYLPIAGGEYRLYPGVLATTQEETYAI